MTYFYEELNDESFQKLAQAILVAVFPEAQCLPVGQPDGGRDAFVRASPKGETKIVFQVKFSRNPDSKTERDVVEEVVETEAKKVQGLIKKGASKYYLISNVKGTSHPEVGSIDKVNAALSDSFGIPAHCWWRDDLDARIDGLSDIKWSFPGIIRGADLLQILVAAALGDQNASRAMAMQAYLAAQHRDDSEVKFKQVELQNKLLDLFVDLPVARKQGFTLQLNERLPLLELPHSAVSYWHDDHMASHRGHNPECASTLLRFGFESPLTRLIVEGAPGQGKSTITQYVCQVNRIRLLSRSDELSRITELDREAPVRVPFRVDLRDYATWLQGRNPFAIDSPTLGAPAPPGLESFLAAQVSSLSGGLAFTTADFVAVAKASHVLVVLDGFDEVADVPTRIRLVDEINKAAARLQANSKSTLVLVTSRPAAFANSPGFSEREWVHLEIQAMGTQHIDQYATKWMAARNLPARERVEFSTLLKEKLEHPHMRDLSRNPMQLTILLALVHTKGPSLPDKRTALYDSYMDLFFSREAEKSRVVRDRRDLLVEIHRYLAWILQTQAERGAGAGSISEVDLKKLLSTYLSNAAHDVRLVEELFTGMVERVVALVSRVQGTFEFEVQPLREYFAARHLYETAPYSPPGGERGGTKPERFEALSRSFYWLNVARFYAGCYSVGELASLADGLEELSNSPNYRQVAHPRMLALSLLGDWVFSQKPQIVRRVVDLVCEEPGFTILLASEGGRGHDAIVALPERCGRDELASHAWDSLSKLKRGGERRAISRIVRENTSVDERITKWLGMEPPTKSAALWLNDGHHLGILEALDETRLKVLVDTHGELALTPLVNAGRYDVVHAYPALFESELSRVLSGDYRASQSRRAADRVSGLELLSEGLYPVRFRSTISNMSAWDPATVASDVRAKYQEVLEYASRIRIGRDVCESATTLDPWEALLDEGVSRFGSQWAFAKLALVAAGIQSRDVFGSWSSDAWNSGGNCQGMRFARLHAGDDLWWSQQLKSEKNPLGNMLALTALAAWGSSRTILSLAKTFGDLLDSQDQRAWSRIHSSVTQILHATERARRPFGVRDKLPSAGSSPRLALLMAARGTDAYAQRVYASNFADYSGSDIPILSFCCSAAAREVSDDWTPALTLFAKAQSIGPIGHSMDFKRQMPVKVAEHICEKAATYPLELLQLAHRRLAARTGAAAPKVGDVAQKKAWFVT
jgi:hypothetical protein